jgi:hypothetical protein
MALEMVALDPESSIGINGRVTILWKKPSSGRESRKMAAPREAKVL